MKACSKCGEGKPLGEYYSRGNVCKECTRARQRAYDAKPNPARKEAQARWREANRDRLRANAKAHYEDNKDRHRESALRWSRENPEYYREYNKKWYAANREKRKQQIADYWAQHPERRAELNRLKESERRARMAGNLSIPFTPEQLAARVAVYGGICWICRANPGVEIDHVKPTTAGGPHMLANLRPACRSCNASKSDTWPFDPSPYRQKEASP